MFDKFQYETVPLGSIDLDPKNPRIVSQLQPKNEDEILSYFFEYEDLEGFIKKVASEGKNLGAERPYVVKNGSKYTVVEGNTRIAAYKILTGLSKIPKNHKFSLPSLSETAKASMLNVECSIAPDRDAMLPIMARSHFGEGDKEHWGYLGSRKAVYDEWKSGRSIASTAKAFNLSQGDTRDLILEYLLYLSALSLKWSKSEKAALLSPKVQFNPPVRFLQGAGHKSKVGISYDKANLKIVFDDALSRRKFKHLITKLVVAPVKGLGATAKYDQVFADFDEGASKSSSSSAASTGSKSNEKRNSQSDQSSNTKKKPYALFSYPTTLNNAVIEQLMKDARNINCKNLPGAGTFLLRAIIETLLKHIIDDQNANPIGKQMDLEAAMNVCLGNTVKLPKDDQKILSEFKKTHLNYLNLGAHGNVVPNTDMLFIVRDAIDQFIKRNI